MESEINKHKKNILSVIRDMGEQLLPIPSSIEVQDGKWTEQAVLIFSCPRSNFSKRYKVSKAGLWLKHFYLLAQVGTATVQILILDWVDAAINISDLVRKLCMDNHEKFSEVFDSPCLKSKEHDKLLKTLVNNDFYKHFEYVIFNDEPHWCIKPHFLDDAEFVNSTEEMQKVTTGCSCLGWGARTRK